jgi:signal transduction histidine kinase
MCWPVLFLHNMRQDIGGFNDGRRSRHVIPIKAERWKKVTKVFDNDAERVRQALERIDQEQSKFARSTLAFRMYYGLIGERAKSMDWIGKRLGVDRNKVVQLRDQAEELLQDPRWREESARKSA